MYEYILAVIFMVLKIVKNVRIILSKFHNLISNIFPPVKCIFVQSSSLY